MAALVFETFQDAAEAQEQISALSVLLLVLWFVSGVVTLALDG